MTENENPTLVDPIGSGAGTGGASTATAPPPPPPSPPPTYPVRPQLRRSRTDRVIAGVCGGIARQYGIDAVLLRILVVVATLFSGGVFLIAYVLAWLFIADDPLLVPVMAAGQPGQPMAPVPGQPTAYAAGGTGSYVDPATGQVYGAASPAPYAPPQRTEPRSYLGLLTVSAAVVVGALLALIDALGAHISGLAIFASMLAVLGIGMLVGGWRGRARWLIAPAIVLLLLVQGTAAVHHLAGSSGIGDRRWVPTAVTQSYELGAGTGVIDLRKQKWPSSDVAVKLGIGEITVLVPDDVTLVVDAQVGAGEIDLPGQRPQSGSSLTVSTTVGPVSAPGPTNPVGTTVNLKADIGLGQLVVRRATS
jgi:phage shock protein PspC (stress-responsive transcriptional regulator)